MCTPDCRVVVPSKKVTVPVRLPVPAPVVKVSLKMTLWPKEDGLGLDASIMVTALAGMALPTSMISSGLLTVWLATSNSPKRGLPDLAGENTAVTTQVASTASELAGLQVVVLG